MLMLPPSLGYLPLHKGSRIWSGRCGSCRATSARGASSSNWARHCLQLNESCCLLSLRLVASSTCFPSELLRPVVPLLWLPLCFCIPGSTLFDCFLCRVLQGAVWETIRDRSSQVVICKSPNKHNRVYATAEPLGSCDTCLCLPFMPWLRVSTA